LLWIEYVFHLPLIVAPLVLIWALTSAGSRSDRVGGLVEDQITASNAR
jgi:ABC-type molybdate transport system permease subunit